MAQHQGLTMDDAETHDDTIDPCPLILRHLDRQTTPAEDVRLTEILRNDPEARRVFVEICHDGGLLREMQRPTTNPVLNTPHLPFLSVRNLAVVALAACLIAAIIIRLVPTSTPALTVAMITGVDNCRWTEPAPDPGVGLPALDSMQDGWPI